MSLPQGAINELHPHEVEHRNNREDHQHRDSDEGDDALLRHALLAHNEEAPVGTRGFQGMLGWTWRVSPNGQTEPAIKRSEKQ